METISGPDGSRHSPVLIMFEDLKTVQSTVLLDLFWYKVCQSIWSNLYWQNVASKCILSSNANRIGDKLEVSLKPNVLRKGAVSCHVVTAGLWTDASFKQQLLKLRGSHKSNARCHCLERVVAEVTPCDLQRTCQYGFMTSSTATSSPALIRSDRK